MKDDDGSIAGCHGSDKAKAEAQMAALYASEEERQMDKDQEARSLFDKFWDGLKNLFVERAWDGSASNYDGADDYCKSCLIDVNSAAGRDTKTQQFCMLPVKSPGSNEINPEGLQAAAGGRGITRVERPADVPQDAWDSAVKSAANTIISNYPKLLDRNAPDSVYEIAGKTPPQRAISGSRLNEALWGMMFDLDNQEEGSDNYLIDTYHENGNMYALYTDRGKLYRYPVVVNGDSVSLGERMQVTEMHVPVMQSRFVIRQQPDGRYRWFSVSATAVLNRVGEIDSRDLFDSFVKHAEETGEYPIRQFFHQGDMFKTGQADFLAREGYCYITSGIYDDTPIGLAEVKARQANPDYWGDSIGFLPTVEPELSEITNGINIPVYWQGVNKEISTLPEDLAASLFTRTEVTRTMNLSENAGKVWTAWLKLWGDDEAAAKQWLEQNPEARNRAIETAGLITREADGQEPTEPQEDATDEGTQEQEPAEPQELVVDEEVIAQLTRSIGEAEFMTTLVKRLETTEVSAKEFEATIKRQADAISKLTKRLEALEVDKDKRQQQYQDDMPAQQQRVSKLVFRPRQARAPKTEDGQAEEVDEMAAWQQEKKNNKIPSY